MTDRAVSTTLGYALTLAITTLLVTGLLVGVGGFVEDQRERAIRSELQVVGQQMAADVQAGDRFAETGDTTFTIRRDLPNEVAGTSYTVEVVGDPANDPPEETYLRLSTSNPDIVVEVDMALRTHIEEASFTGSRLVVSYDTGTGKLEVDNDG